MVELHVNANCEGIKNYTYKDHSSLGEMHTIQNYVCEGEPPNAVQLQLFIKNRYIRSQYGKEPENELGTWWGQHVNTNFLESFWNIAYKTFSFALSLNFLFYRIIRHPLGCQAFLTC